MVDMGTSDADSAILSLLHSLNANYATSEHCVVTIIQACNVV